MEHIYLPYKRGARQWDICLTEKYAIARAD